MYCTLTEKKKWILKQDGAQLLLVICIVQYKQRRFSTYKCRQVYLTVNLIGIPKE